MIPKIKKEKSIKQLKAELWKIFSLYIRQRDNFKCISCGKQCDRNTSEAGHFVHNTMDFNEWNINCQCTRCNHFLHGNLANYALVLQEKIGGQKVQLLLGQKHKVTKYGYNELRVLIGYYKARIKKDI